MDKTSWTQNSCLFLSTFGPKFPRISASKKHRATHLLLCPRSLAHNYIASHCTEMDKTYLTHNSCIYFMSKNSWTWALKLGVPPVLGIFPVNVGSGVVARGQPPPLCSILLILDGSSEHVCAHMKENRPFLPSI